MEDEQSLVLLLASTVIFALLWWLLSKAASAEREDEAVDNAQSIEQLTRHNHALEEENNKLNNKLGDLSRDLDQKDEAICTLNQIVSDSEAKMAQLKSQLQEKEVQKIQLSQLLRRSQRTRRQDQETSEMMSDSGLLTPCSVKSTASSTKSKPRISDNGETQSLISVVSVADEEVKKELADVIKLADEEKARLNMDITMLNNKVRTQMVQLEEFSALRENNERIQADHEHLLGQTAKLQATLEDVHQQLLLKTDEATLLKSSLQVARSELEDQCRQFEHTLQQAGLEMNDLSLSTDRIGARSSESIISLAGGLADIEGLVTQLSSKLEAKIDEVADLALRLSSTAKALDSSKSQCLQLEADKYGLQAELDCAKAEINKANALASDSKAALESEAATLGSEGRILKAHNASLSSELENLKQDLDAFMVENDQLNIQNEMYAAAMEELINSLAGEGVSSTVSSSGGSSEIDSFISHQPIVPMKIAMQMFDQKAANGAFAPSEFSLTDASPLPRQLRFQQQKETMAPPPPAFSNLSVEQQITPLPLRRNKGGPRVCSMLWSSPVNTFDVAGQRRDEEELAQRLNTIRSLANQVPGLRSQLSSAQRELLAVRSEFEKLLTDADDARSDAMASKKLLRDLEERHATCLENLQSKLELAAKADEGMRAELEKELETSLSKIEFLEVRVQDLTRELYCSADDKDRAHDTVESLRKELRIATAALEELRLTSDALDGLRGDAEELHQEKEKSAQRKAEEDQRRSDLEATIRRLEATIEHQRTQIDSYVDRIGRSVIEVTSLKLTVEQLRSHQARGELSFSSFPASHAVESVIASAASSCGGALHPNQTVSQAYDLLVTATELSTKMKDVHQRWRSSISPRTTKDHDLPAAVPLDLSFDKDQDSPDGSLLQQQFDELQNAYGILTQQFEELANQLRPLAC